MLRSRRRALPIVAVVLLAGLAGFDRALAWRVENAIEDRLGCEDAKVEVDGFPVTWQVVRGDLDRVRIDLGTFGWREVTFSAEVELSGVTTSAPPTARHADVSVLVRWDQLKSALAERHEGHSRRWDDAELSAASASVIAVTSGAGLLAPRLLVEVGLDDDAVAFEAEGVEVAGRRVPADMLAALAGRDLADVDRTFPLDLPDGFHLTDVGVVEDGLRLELVGEDIGAEAGGSGGACDGAGEA